MTNNTPLDELMAQFDRRASQLSDVEMDDLQAVFATYMQRLSEPHYCERHPGFSLSVVLKESLSEPSEQLTEVVEMLEGWLSQPKLDSLIEALIDQMCRD